MLSDDEPRDPHEAADVPADDPAGEPGGTAGTGTQAPPRQLVLCGVESSGKSSLAAGLAGGPAREVANYRGSTVAVHHRRLDDVEVVDTPGIVRGSDIATTAAAIDALEHAQVVVVVAQATRVDDDLATLLPLVAGRRGLIVLSFADRIDAASAARGRLRLQAASGVPVVTLDARHLDDEDRGALLAAAAQAAELPAEAPRLGWLVEPRPGLLEHRGVGAWVAAALLLAPALAAVLAANELAGLVEPWVEQLLDPLVGRADTLPALPAGLLAGDYGLVTMFPLLFVWAAPTVVIYALLLGAYKASGLLDRLTAAVHPLVRPLGVAGRDVVRVLMGLGCNVPAVISTRSCSSCTRDTTISAIAFGSACSYQLGATLAVFAAVGRPGLVVPFLAYLLLTTLVFTRLVSEPIARDRTNLLVLERRVFLQRPRRTDIWREASTAIRQFFGTAVPIFLGITLIAALLAVTGVLDAIGDALAPAMALLRLPGDAALAVVLASVRKDGLLLLGSDAVAPGLDGLQVLTGVYLAGVLVPCLVTALTIARERSPGFAARLLARQGLAAVAFTAVLAWGGAWLLGLR